MATRSSPSLLLVKIVLICSNYLPFLGGVEIHAQQVARALSGAHQVSVAAMNFSACRHPQAFAVLHDNLLAPAAPAIRSDKPDSANHR